MEELLHFVLLHLDVEKKNKPKSLGFLKLIWAFQQLHSEDHWNKEQASFT